MILRARVVLPVAHAPIENGAIAISGNRITAVGAWRELRSNSADEVHDLGDVILLPGLINAHCHLDYTDFAGEFLPTKYFTDWIKLITTAKASWSYSDYAQSWMRGAEMLLRNGVTTVADIESIPELLPEVWNATPLRVFSFLEMTGVKRQRDPRVVLEEAVKKIDSLGKSSRCAAGLSPHAPYSTVPELLRLAAEAARRRRELLTIHVAESAEESEMFTNSRGVMFDWLRGNQRDLSDCGLGSPVQHLARNRVLGANVLAVHANYLADGDAELLGKKNVSVVHCPRSHDFFSHRDFPYEELEQAGVNICLGTDSLATLRKSRNENSELNLFAEMRAFAAKRSAVSAENILRMATINAARALNRSGKIGELSEKAFADLIAIPFAGEISDAYDAVINFSGSAKASIIDGQWAVNPT